MIGRIATTALAGSIALFSPIGSALATDAKDNDTKEKIVLRKDQDDNEVATIVDRDDDRDDNTGTGGTGDTNSGFTSGVDSKDGTNSRKTAPSRDRDHSRGDLTRDRTKDGPGKNKRDWSKNNTNDGSRNDTR